MKRMETVDAVQIFVTHARNLVPDASVEVARRHADDDADDVTHYIHVTGVHPSDLVLVRETLYRALFERDAACLLPIHFWVNSGAPNARARGAGASEHHDEVPSPPTAKNLTLPDVRGAAFMLLGEGDAIPGVTRNVTITGLKCRTAPGIVLPMPEGAESPTRQWTMSLRRNAEGRPNATTAPSVRVK
ncbi:MAG: hypothetical protein HY719_11535 [Planctomycetes bacterium]|nr:hypothetical protein [Planctomycetota bacterium]